MEQTLTTSLLDNKLALKGLFGTATDFYTKDITLMGYPACICMFEGLSSIERLWIMMLDVLSKPDVQPETISSSRRPFRWRAKALSVWKMRVRS